MSRNETSYKKRPSTCLETLNMPRRILTLPRVRPLAVNGVLQFGVWRPFLDDMWNNGRCSNALRMSYAVR